MDNQMEMAFMNQGGLKDDGMKQDPISGNPIPNGSMAEEVRDDIPAQLSEGEYVVPADVVRYYGVKHFEDIRNNAKQGLQSMEANGRIGGEPVPVGGPVASGLNPEEMNEIQSMMMNIGGFVDQPSDPYQQQRTMYKQPMAMSRGGLGFIPTTPANLSPTVVSGSFSKSPAQQAAEAAANATAKATEVAKNKVTLYGPNGEEVSVVFPSEEYNQYIAQGYTTAKPVTPKDDGPDNPSNTTGGGSTGSGSVGFEDWGKDVDWSDPETYAKNIYNSVSGNTEAAKTGAGIATALGAPALGVIAGIGAAYKTGQAISDIKAAKILAEAQGLPTDSYDKYAKDLLENAGGILKLGNTFNLLDGTIKATNVLDRLNLNYNKNDPDNPTFSTEDKNYNKNIYKVATKKETKKILGDSGGSGSDDPTITETAISDEEARRIASDNPFDSRDSRDPNPVFGGTRYTFTDDDDDEDDSVFDDIDQEFKDAGVSQNKGGLMRKKKTKGK